MWSMGASNIFFVRCVVTNPIKVIKNVYLSFVSLFKGTSLSRDANFTPEK